MFNSGSSNHCLEALGTAPKAAPKAHSCYVIAGRLYYSLKLECFIAGISKYQLSVLFLLLETFHLSRELTIAYKES